MRKKANEFAFCYYVLKRKNLSHDTDSNLKRMFIRYEQHDWYVSYLVSLAYKVFSSTNTSWLFGDATLPRISGRQNNSLKEEVKFIRIVFPLDAP